MDITAEIRRLKEDRHAVILAHNYQSPEVQDIADHVGDSLELSRLAASLPGSLIVFCGVRFMAETAKVLSPQKTVLLPEENAGCPMAEMIEPAQVRALREKHPDAAVVGYVNTTVETKALCDICCTSSNALKVVESLPQQEIIFLPDRNLGGWVARSTKKNIICHPGFCIVHENLRPSQVRAMKEKFPSAIVIAHPECSPAVLDLADTVQSTGGMLKFVGQSGAREFIIATEEGMNHRLSRLYPDRVFHPMEPAMTCLNMKKTTLESVLGSLRDMVHEIRLSDELIASARKPLERMISIG
jgi:quinolinate synthase